MQQWWKYLNHCLARENRKPAAIELFQSPFSDPWNKWALEQVELGIELLKYEQSQRSRKTPQTTSGMWRLWWWRGHRSHEAKIAVRAFLYLWWLESRWAVLHYRQRLLWLSLSHRLYRWQLNPLIRITLCSRWEESWYCNSGGSKEEACQRSRVQEGVTRKSLTPVR